MKHPGVGVCRFIGVPIIILYRSFQGLARIFGFPLLLLYHCQHQLRHGLQYQGGGTVKNFGRALQVTLAELCKGFGNPEIIRGPSLDRGFICVHCPIDQSNCFLGFLFRGRQQKASAACSLCDVWIGRIAEAREQSAARLSILLLMPEIETQLEVSVPRCMIEGICVERFFLHQPKAFQWIRSLSMW